MASKKQMIIGSLVVAIFASLLAAPSINALSLDYSNTAWASFSVTGPNITQPGSVEVYTVTGRLSSNMTGGVYLTLRIPTTEQPYYVLRSYNVLDVGKYIAGDSFIRSYQVTIPDNAANNQYIYANVEAGSSKFTNFTITLVQSPTYAELQAKIVQLQSNVTSLTAELDELQSSYEALHNNFTNNSASLQAEKEALQRQVNNLNSANNELQAQLSDLQATNEELTAQIANLQSNSSDLQTQIDTLQTEKQELLNQTSILQTQVNALKLNSTNLQAIVNNFNIQLASLQENLNKAQSDNSATTILLYAAVAIAAAFIAATAYIMLLTFKKKKNNPDTKKPNPEEVPLF